jgi:hypothetical protein
MLVGLATPPAHATDAPKPAIDLTVAFECREVRTWEGYGFTAGNLDDAVASYERRLDFRDRAVDRAQTNADIDKAWDNLRDYEKDAKLTGYEKRILVADNHGVADTATVADPFWRSRIVEATDNSITIARDYDKDHEWLSLSVHGTIDRRSGHGEIYTTKLEYMLQNDGSTHTKEVHTNFVVECAAAQPAKF